MVFVYISEGHNSWSWRTGEWEMTGFFSKMRSHTSMTEKIIQEKDPISNVLYFGISFTTVIMT